MSPGTSASAGAARDGDPYERARQIALRQLDIAPRSRHHLEEKLLSKECPPEIVAEVLDRLEEVGLVDDAAFAGMLVRSKRSSRGLSRRGLRQELRKKGIVDSIAEVELSTISEDDEREEARRLVDRRLRAMHGLAPQVQVRRLAGMLSRRGYPGDITASVIREAMADAEEHRRD